MSPQANCLSSESDPFHNTRKATHGWPFLVEILDSICSKHYYDTLCSFAALDDIGLDLHFCPIGAKINVATSF